MSSNNSHTEILVKNTFIQLADPTSTASPNVYGKNESSGSGKSGHLLSSEKSSRPRIESCDAVLYSTTYTVSGDAMEDMSRVTERQQQQYQLSNIPESVEDEDEMTGVRMPQSVARQSHARQAECPDMFQSGDECLLSAHDSDMLTWSGNLEYDSITSSTEPITPLRDNNMLSEGNCNFENSQVPLAVGSDKRTDSNFRISQYDEIDNMNYNCGNDSIDVSRLPSVGHNKTTIMLRNIPNKYSQKMVLDVINQNFEGLYDFFYLPIDFRNKCNVGYAFINFISPYYAESFKQKFVGVKLDAFKSRKICEVSWGRVQGLQANIEHYRNSAVMSIPNELYRPILMKNGIALPFPAPNATVPSVKLRPQKQA